MNFAIIVGQCKICAFNVPLIFVILITKIAWKKTHKWGSKRLIVGIRSLESKTVRFDVELCKKKEFSSYSRQLC